MFYSVDTYYRTNILDLVTQSITMDTVKLALNKKKVNNFYNNNLLYQ